MRSLLREVEKLAIHSPAPRPTLVLQRCPSGLVEVIPISIKSLQNGKKPMRLVSLGLHCRDTLKDFRQNNVELKIGVLGELAIRHNEVDLRLKLSARAEDSDFLNWPLWMRGREAASAEWISLMPRRRGSSVAHF